MLTAMRNYFRKDVVLPEAVEWHRQYSHTPDLWFLEQHIRQNIFIPDDFQTDRPNHHLLEGNIPIHPTCYTHDQYTMWNKDLGVHSFPLPFEKGIDFGVCSMYKPELAKIKGELYSLPTYLFWKVLDIQKENTVKFSRKRVTITLPFREVRFSHEQPLPRISRDYIRTIRAWMYVANPEYWDDFIGSHLGSKATPIYEHDVKKDWIDKFYRF